MVRHYCQTCLRPKTACICQFVSKVENRVRVLVLQHPSEVKQSKGTLTLLAHSLAHCQVIVGEDFSDNLELRQILAHYQERVFLLYPSENAEALPGTGELAEGLEEYCLILLDATWKKAYRMFMLSKPLHTITHCRLPEGIQGQYVILTTKKAHALSTLEACCYALGALEKAEQKYTGLLAAFNQFNQFQLRFRQQGGNAV